MEKTLSTPHFRVDQSDEGPGFYFGVDTVDEGDFCRDSDLELELGVFESREEAEEAARMFVAGYMAKRSGNQKARLFAAGFNFEGELA